MRSLQTWNPSTST